MTSKEKAEELILKFREVPQKGTMMFYLAFEISKRCALIAVDEILNNCYEVMKPFWLEVKKEIESL